MNFLKNNWIYMAVAFAVVFLAGIGYVTYTRLNQLSTEPVPEVSTLSPAPALSPAPSNETELTFQITPSVPTISELSCIELVATPLTGPSPLTVSFTGLAGDTGTTIQFMFDFGDDTTESFEKNITGTDHTTTQFATHTYMDSGSYEAILTVGNETEQKSSSSCTITITVGNSPTVQPTRVAQASTPLVLSPTPTLIVAATRIPTPTAAVIASVSTTPMPTADVAAPNVPQAGSFLPTVLALAGSIAIVILAVAIL